MSEMELKRKVDEIVDDDVECSNKKTVVDQEIGNTFSCSFLIMFFVAARKLTQKKQNWFYFVRLRLPSPALKFCAPN